MRRLPFQDAGVAHLLSDRVRLLADQMGLGKTCQAIGASEAHDEPVTVLAPAMLIAEWRDELDAWCDVPRDIAVIGAKKGPDPVSAGVTLCSYNRAAKPENFEILRRRRSAHLILDECHYLKSAGTSRAAAVLGDHIAPGLSHRAGRVSFLTGTPCPNDAGELWQMLRTAGIYDGAHHDFLMEYCRTRQTPYGLKVRGYKNAAGLRQMLDGFMLRRANMVALPPSSESELVVAPDAASSNAAILAVRNVDQAVAEMVERAATRGNFDQLETPHLASIRRAVGLAKAHATGKAAAELLASDPAAKIVLFCIHKDVIEILRDILIDFSPVVLAGGIAEATRKKSKDRFQADPDCRAAICQIKAAGTGLTLTAANHLWLVEPSWSPADNDQAKRRILRIGQQRETSIKMVSLDNSIDQAVNRVLLEKRELIDEIIGDSI